MPLRVTGYGYTFSISRRDSTRSIRGLMPSSLEMASESSIRDVALAQSPSPSRTSIVSAQAMIRIDQVYRHSVAVLVPHSLKFLTSARAFQNTHDFFKTSLAGVG